MARMIPPTIGEDAPPGEHVVFAALQAAPDDWVVFHSLEIARHVSQVQGEADFVVVAPAHGLLVLEVKSHESIESDGEGRWRYGNRDWVTRGPFEQASGVSTRSSSTSSQEEPAPSATRFSTPRGSPS